MFIYNITMTVEWSIHAAWLKWIGDVYIPKMLSTGSFKKYQFIQLIEIDETEGPTYALQLYTETKEDYTRYIELYATALNKVALDLWKDKVVSFSTLLKIVY